MAYTQADLNNIEAAIKTGTFSVKIDGREVTYRSLEEMMAIRATIKAEVNGSSSRQSTTLASFGRG